MASEFFTSAPLSKNYEGMPLKELLKRKQGGKRLILFGTDVRSIYARAGCRLLSKRDRAAGDFAVVPIQLERRTVRL